MTDLLNNRDLNYAIARWKRWGWVTDQIASILRKPEHVVYNSLARWKEVRRILDRRTAA